ncbi:hypothetical protein [Methylophilus sp. QUAN]|uniref:hypothetical protein n=1 Tax=Methylophilus sp. QUAN TaxID=2781020 RepID=UPI00188ECBBA|nr:hypothetical protein [Methylophilus sp. QUAN]MBF4991090.1 hypothetical protein [Methylophilus sp. QUAN]
MRKKYLVAVLIVVVLSACKKPEDKKTEISNSLEYKVASIDAGKFLPESDLSIARVNGLLNAAEEVYATPKQQVADFVVNAHEVAKQHGAAIGAAELLDFALIACDVKCTKDNLVDYLTRYTTVRITSGQTHHQATHSVVILNNLEKRLK